MRAAQAQADLENALHEVRQAGVLLIRPDPKTLEQSANALANGIFRIEQLARQKLAADPDLFGLARQLQAAIWHTEYLLRTASDYHHRWLDILRARMTGYTAAGDPEHFRGAPRVFVQG